MTAPGQDREQCGAFDVVTLARDRVKRVRADRRVGDRAGTLMPAGELARGLSPNPQQSAGDGADQR